MAFTINIGDDNETDYRDFNSILTDLGDNDLKYINPKHVRDAVFFYLYRICFKTNRCWW